MELLEEIMTLCIVPLLGILIKYLGAYLSAKRDELKAKTDSELGKKYIDMIYNTVQNCVKATNQTYVDSLKKEGSFTAEAQKEAFNRTMNAVLSILAEDAKDYILETTGDLQTYLTQLIESEVKTQK